MRLPTLAGLAGWAVAAATAVKGQSLATTSHPEDARPWLIAAAVLGFLAVRLLELGCPAGADTEPHPPLGTNTDLAPVTRRTRRQVGGVLLMAFGGLYSGLAAVLLAVQAAAAIASWIWLMGIAALVAGAILGDRRPPRPRWRPGRQASLELGLLVIIVGLAVALRLPSLAATPPSVHGDEADVGLLARDILAGRMPVLFATAPAAEATALTFAIHAATMRVFGDDLFGLRLASVIEGVLSVVLLFLLARRLWGARPALLAATFLAMAAWHIHFSRTGFHYMQADVAMLLALYFLVRGLQDRRVVDWVLCGIAVGVCVEVYYAARLAPVVVAVYVAYRAATERGFLQAHARGLLVLLFAAAVCLAPMAIVYGRSQGSFVQRAAAVLVISPNNLDHELDGLHVSSVWQVLAIQAQHTIEAFNIRGETSLEYGHTGPLFDFWTDALLAMGSIAILLRLGSARGVLLASWVWLALLLGSVMTTDALFSPHLVVAIPALVLAPALMLERAWSSVSGVLGRAGTYAFGVPVVVLLGLALQGNVHDYFDVQIVERQPAGRFTLLSNYAASINAGYRLYVIGRPDWTLRYDTPRFLVPSPDAVDVRNAPLALPLDRIPVTKGVAFLVENGADGYAQRLEAIRQSYPDGRQVVISERPGQPTFTSYLVENSALAAADSAASRD